MSGIDTSQGINSVASQIALLDTNGTQAVLTNTGATVTGMAAAAYEFGSILASYPADAPPLTQSAPVFQVTNADGSTSMVSLSDLATDIQKHTGFDPLIEFSSGIGSTNKGYSIADINSVLSSLENQFPGQMSFTQLAQVEGNQALVSNTDINAQYQDAINQLQALLSASQGLSSQTLLASPAGVGLDTPIIYDPTTSDGQQALSYLSRLPGVNQTLVTLQNNVAQAQAAFNSASDQWPPADQIAVATARAAYIAASNNASWPTKAADNLAVNNGNLALQNDAHALGLVGLLNTNNLPPDSFFSSLQASLKGVTAGSYMNFNSLAIGAGIDTTNATAVNQFLSNLQKLMPSATATTNFTPTQLSNLQTFASDYKTWSQACNTYLQNQATAVQGAWNTYQTAIQTAANNQVSAIQSAHALLNQATDALTPVQDEINNMLSGVMALTSSAAQSLKGQITQLQTTITANQNSCISFQEKIDNATQKGNAAASLAATLSAANTALSANPNDATAQANLTNAISAISAFTGNTDASYSDALTSINNYQITQSTSVNNLQGQLTAASVTLQNNQTQLQSLQTQLLGQALGTPLSLNDVLSNIKQSTGVDLSQALAPVIGGGVLTAANLNQIYQYLNQDLPAGSQLPVMSNDQLIQIASQQLAGLFAQTGFKQALSSSPNGIDPNAAIFNIPGSNVPVSLNAALKSIDDGTGVNLSTQMSAILSGGPITQQAANLVNILTSPPMTVTISGGGSAVAASSFTVTGTLAAEYKLANQLNQVDLNALSNAGSPISADAAIFTSNNGSGSVTNLSLNQLLQNYANQGYNFSNLLPTGSKSFTLGDLGAMVDRLNADQTQSAFKVPDNAVFSSLLSQVRSDVASSSSTAQTSAINLLAAAGVADPQGTFTKMQSATVVANRSGSGKGGANPQSSFVLPPPAADSTFVANLTNNFSVQDLRSSQVIEVDNAGASAIAGEVNNFSVDPKVQSALGDIGTALLQLTPSDFDANYNVSSTSAIFNMPDVAQFLGQSANTPVSFAQIQAYELQSRGVNLSQALPNLVGQNGLISLNNLSNLLDIAKEAVPSLNVSPLQGFATSIQNSLNNGTISTYLAQSQTDVTVSSQADVNAAIIGINYAYDGQGGQGSGLGALTAIKYAGTIAGILGIAQPSTGNSPPTVAQINAQYQEVAAAIAAKLPFFPLPKASKDWTAFDVKNLITQLSNSQSLAVKVGNPALTFVTNMRLSLDAITFNQPLSTIDTLGETLLRATYAINNITPPRTQASAASEGSTYTNRALLGIGVQNDGEIQPTQPSIPAYANSIAGFLGIPQPTGAITSAVVAQQSQLVQAAIQKYLPNYQMPASMITWTPSDVTNLVNALTKASIQPATGLPPATLSVLDAKTSLQNIGFEDVATAVQSGQASAAVTSSFNQKVDFEAIPTLSPAEIDSQITAGSLYVSKSGHFYLNRQPTTARDASVAAFVVGGNALSSKLNNLMNDVNTRNTNVQILNYLSAATSVSDLKTRLQTERTQYGYADVLSHVTGGALSDGTIPTLDSDVAGTTGNFQSILKTSIDNATKNQDLDTQNLQSLTTQVQSNNTAITQLLQAYEQLLKSVAQNFE